MTVGREAMYDFDSAAKDFRRGNQEAGLTYCKLGCTILQSLDGCRKALIPELDCTVTSPGMAHSAAPIEFLAPRSCSHLPGSLGFTLVHCLVSPKWNWC